MGQPCIDIVFRFCYINNHSGRDRAIKIPRRSIFCTMDFADSKKKIYLHFLHSHKMRVGYFPLFFCFLRGGDYYIRLCVLFHVMEVLKFYG